MVGRLAHLVMGGGLDVLDREMSSLQRAAERVLREVAGARQDLAASVAAMAGPTEPPEGDNQ